MPKKEVDVPALFRLWAEGVRQCDICTALGIPTGSFHAIRQRYALPVRACDKQLDFTETEPPTPEEIAERAAVVRAGWSDEERERRIVGRSRSPVRLRSYSFNHRDFAATALD